MLTLLRKLFGFVQQLGHLGSKTVAIAVLETLGTPVLPQFFSFGDTPSCAQGPLLPGSEDSVDVGIEPGLTYMQNKCPSH